jgi:hypothetical protein
MVPHPVVGNAGICQRRRAAACSTLSAHTRPSPGAAPDSNPGYKLKASLSTFSLALCLAWRRRHFNLLYPTCGIPACPARPQERAMGCFAVGTEGAITQKTLRQHPGFLFFILSERATDSCTIGHARPCQSTHRMMSLTRTRAHACMHSMVRLIQKYCHALFVAAARSRHTNDHHMHVCQNARSKFRLPLGRVVIANYCNSRYCSSSFVSDPAAIPVISSIVRSNLIKQLYAQPFIFMFPRR